MEQRHGERQTEERRRAVAEGDAGPGDLHDLVRRPTRAEGIMNEIPIRNVVKREDPRWPQTRRLCSLEGLALRLDAEGRSVDRIAQIARASDRARVVTKQIGADDHRDNQNIDRPVTACDRLSSNRAHQARIRAAPRRRRPRPPPR